MKIVGVYDLCSIVQNLTVRFALHTKLCPINRKKEMKMRLKLELLNTLTFRTLIILGIFSFNNFQVKTDFNTHDK